MDIHLEILPEATKTTFSLLEKNPLINNFYLAGGTALALQIGHRISNDLDFFSQNNFDENILIQKLSQLGKLELEKKEEQSVIGILNGTKISFLGYNYPLLDKMISINNLKMASLLDIACMKIDAIASRGTKRDFIDVYFLAKEFLPLNKILDNFRRKFSSLNYNIIHVEKSLVYFDDAEIDMEPKMIKLTNWNSVKDFFKQEIKNIS